ncbi:DUF4054 domain-containing protein [Swingsia samuiensis]|uniref:DUF4054 domain-containing protein n=1 Tax=Swingsia samuiensis TaxID=1293412 RepID=A0A4Y6UII7_9PROT|nr:DUF4054 domain-containing protein [Swingsia samuiensis]QDH17413.1 DUF4054 domain-containing protein [Swingsia samuiensis]
MTDTTTPTPGVVTFDYTVWSQRFPSLAKSVNEGLAKAYFDEATLFLNNTPYSLVRDVNKRAALLGYLTAHIAQLNLPKEAGGNGAGIVGRVSNASRGSVSISVDNGTQAGSAAWFMQTQYGATYWQMTAFLRQMRLIPGTAPRPRIWP